MMTNSTKDGDTLRFVEIKSILLCASIKPNYLFWNPLVTPRSNSIVETGLFFY
jgi:hypothetical protein